MKLKVCLVPHGQGTNEIAHVWIECGTGEQILRWLAYVSCSRLAYIKGDTPQLYIPQSVLSMDGQILDVDTVLNELYEDGDSLYVEFSSGPEAFKARWEGRPNTPPFQWGDEGMVGPSEHEWLDELDLKAYGIDKLVNEDLVAQNPAALEQDLAATKDVLRQYAGGLQAIWKYYESQGSNDPRDLDKMFLDQFRSTMLDSHITNDNYKSSAIDECFAKAQDSPGQKESSKRREAATALGLPEFFIAIVFVANGKYAMGLEGPAWGYAELSVKVTHLLTDFVFANVAPGLTQRLQGMDASITPNSQLLLKKGRRLTEQTLDSCQLRRVASAERRLDVKYLCTHLKKWDLLGKEFDLATLMQLLLFAKHPEPEVTKMELKRHPMEVNYDEFERLLLGISFHMYKQAPREEPFEEFLGETLDDIYKKAGVLVEVKK